MQGNKSQGRHGGNRGSGQTQAPDDPNKRPGTDADSLAENRNESKAGGKKFGG